LRRSSAGRAYNGSFHSGAGFGMIGIVSGVILVIVSCAAFWYLLPRDGKVHPLVENSDVGSMVTITIMTGITVGLAVMFGGAAG
jgi:hypothetical protein